MRHQFAHLLPQEVLQDWDYSLPMDFRTISPALLSATFQEGIDIILASPPTLAIRVSNPNKDHPLPGPAIARHITNLVLHTPLQNPDTRGRIYLELYRATSAIRTHHVLSMSRTTS